jgi:type VI secretion system protein ImpK
MQSALVERVTIRRTPAQSGDDIVLMATPVLELIMKIRAGIVQPSNDLRATMDELLKLLEQEAHGVGYNEAPVQATKFALAAFADETVLTADFPLRHEWEKYPLQLEYFGEHMAGMKFYDRLDDLMKAPEENADVIEVYYICLLVGYRGKFKIYYEDQVRGVIERVADSLRRVNRLRTGALSPHWKVSDQPELLTDKGIPTWAKVTGAGALGLMLLLYLIFSFWLNSSLASATRELLR